MNDLARSVFRMTYLFKMIELEANYQKQLGAQHQAKYELNKMANAVSGGIKNIKASLKLSGDVYEKEISQSIEKINAMHNVLTKMADMSEEDVLKIEELFIGSFA